MGSDDNSACAWKGEFRFEIVDVPAITFGLCLINSENQKAIDRATFKTGQGILEGAIILKRENGNYRFLSGTAPFYTAMISGQQTVRCCVFEGRMPVPEEVLVLNEYLPRRDFNPIHEAQLLKACKEKHGLKPADLIAMLGIRKKTYFSESLGLNRLPEQIKFDRLHDNAVAKRVLIKISKLKNEIEMVEAYEEAKKKSVCKPKRNDTKLDGDSLAKLIENAVDGIFSFTSKTENPISEPDKFKIMHSMAKFKEASKIFRKKFDASNFLKRIRNSMD